MTRYVLDTNIVSLLDPGRQAHACPHVDWMARNGADLNLSVMTITELEAGALMGNRDRHIKSALLVSTRRAGSGSADLMCLSPFPPHLNVSVPISTRKRDRL